MRPDITDAIIQALTERTPASARAHLAPLGFHESVCHVLSLFNFGHLPPHIAAQSRPFAELAASIVASATALNAEHTVALRKLLEAKDAAVRAYLL